MAEETRARFRSPEAALRFYFRASELLCDDPTPGLFSRRQSVSGGPPGPNVIGDFLAVDSCFEDLNEVEIWLLKELYGPDCFGAPQRKVADLFKEARRRFPKDQWTPRMVSRFKQRALGVIEQKLRRSHLI